MLAILPLCTLVLLLALFYQSYGCWRRALLLAAIVWGVLLTGMTEFLSMFKLLTLGWLFGVWIVASIVVLVALSRVVRKRKQLQAQDCLPKQHHNLESPLKNSIFCSLIFGIGFIVAIVGLIALIAPPNTMDSMYYHMVRVVHWQQNHSVDHYPAHFTPQLFLAPWAEFAILHLQILSDSDRYANLVQWFSMIGSIVGCSLIAQQLGANLGGQILASVFCTTIPMGILQASGTQNDYAVAFWLVCLVHFVLLAMQAQPTKANYLQIGASLGLATLTKPTAYLYSFPFLVWLLIFRIKSRGWRLEKPIVQLTVPFLLINACHYARNWSMFHSPLGSPPDDIAYNNRIYSLPTFLSNIVRNLALHFSTPSTSINQVLIKGLTLFHSILKVDINDPRTSSSHFQLNSLVNHEDFAGNLLHILLIFAAILCFSFVWKRKQKQSYPLISYYLFSVISGFILFCFVLVWTPFNTRLQLSIFVLFAPFIGCAFSAILRIRVVSAIAAILLVLSSPWVFFNETRPVVANSKFVTNREVRNIFNTSRTSQYFITRPDLEMPTIAAINFLKSGNCQNVGLFLPIDAFEYPLWMLLHQDNSRIYQIEDIGVENISVQWVNSSTYQGFQSCKVFANQKSDAKLSNLGDSYTMVWFSSPAKILQPLLPINTHY